MISALDWSGRRARKALDPARPDASREAEWVRAAQRGDRQAMDSLVRLHQDKVYAFLYRLTNDRDVALDLTQDTFLKAFRGLGGFKEDSALGPWLMAIARNCFRDHVRVQQPEALEPDETGAEDPALVRLASDAGVLEALQHVPSPFREALVLRHVDDLSYDQIAQTLGAPLGTVKTWIHRGRERLRSLLEKGGGA